MNQDKSAADGMARARGWFSLAVGAAPALKDSSPYRNPAKCAFGFLATATGIDLAEAIAGGRRQRMAS